jgi:hypothetical protein
MKLYISMGWMETVKAFSILVPSYMSDSDICFMSVLGRHIFPSYSPKCLF